MKRLLICLCIMFSMSAFADGSDDGKLYPSTPKIQDVPHKKIDDILVPKKKIDLDDFESENYKDKPAPAPVPEPETLALLGVGLVALGLMRKRNQK